MESSGTGRDKGPAFAEALDGALDTLQDMLERRRAEAGAAASGPAGGEADTDPEDLPVLDEVVVPGRTPGPGAFGPATDLAPGQRALAPGAAASLGGAPAAATVLPTHEDLVRRLTSEAEVIIEDSLEEAISRARKEIRSRLRRHLEIVLPEILDELLARTSAARGGKG
jgi:hypothetical protein